MGSQYYLEHYIWQSIVLSISKMPPINLQYELAEIGIYRLSQTKPLLRASRWCSFTPDDELEEIPSPRKIEMRLGWINDCDESHELVRPFSDAQGSLYRRPKMKPKNSLLKVLEGNRLERCSRGEWRHRCVFAVLGTTDKRDIERIKNSPVLQTTTSLHFAGPHHYYLGHRRNRLPHHRHRHPINTPPRGVDNVENQRPNSTPSR